MKPHSMAHGAAPHSDGMSTEARVRRLTREPHVEEARVLALSQMLLAAVVFLSAVLVLILDPGVRIPALMSALAIIGVTTVTAVLLPWKRLPHHASFAAPALDIVAIAVMGESSPASGLGLLWAFPAMWVAWSFGLVLTLAAVGAILLAFSLSLAFDSQVVVTPALLLLPLVIVAFSTLSYLMSRLVAQQRALLDEQSALLESTVASARRDQDMMREVLDAVDFGVARIAGDGTVVLENVTQEGLRRYRDRNVYRMDGVTVVPSEDVPLERARRGEAFEGELVWYGEQGEDRRALSVTARRLPSQGGENREMLIVARDVTAEQLALRARDDLVSSVSHELRTPLTSVLGFLELALDDGTVSRSVARSLRIAQRNAERLLALVSDILSTSTAAHDSGALIIRPSDIDVADVVRTAVEDAGPRAAEAEIIIDATAVRTAHASADPLRIRQVLDNLLSNAIKYNRSGGRVLVECDVVGSAVRVVVSDDGNGISPQEAPQLFDRFFRADAVRNTAIHGSGLGLAISREIVQRHGGQISVQSTPGEGASFIVVLPGPAAERVS